MSNTKTPLSELPIAKAGQSLSGYVREHLEPIERLIEIGIKYEAVLLSMRAAGIDGATYGALDSALFRARKRRKERQEAQNAAEGVSYIKTQPAALPPAKPVVATPLATQRPAIRLTPTADLKQEDLI